MTAEGDLSLLHFGINTFESLTMPKWPYQPDLEVDFGLEIARPNLNGFFI